MKRFLGILLGTVLLLSLFGCTAKLSDGARVLLRVETDAETYTVASSYGEVVKGEDDAYTVLLPARRDILITVGAEGYETVSLPVSADELLAGAVEKTAVLTRKKLHEISIDVAGTRTNAYAECGGVRLDAREGGFVGNFTREELAGGVRVYADGAEPCMLQFSPEELAFTFLERSVYLVPAGMRHVEVVSADTFNSFFAVDRDGNMLLSEENRDRYGTTWHIAVPKTYGGPIFLRPFLATSKDNFVSFSVDADDERYDITFSLGEEARLPTTLLFRLPYDFYRKYAEPDRDSDYGNLWVETDAYLAPAGKLKDGKLDYSYGLHSILFRMESPMELRRVIFNDPFGESAVVATPRAFSPGDTITEDDCTLEFGPLSPEQRSAAVYDSVTGEPFAGSVVFAADGGDEILSSDGRPFAWREEFTAEGGLYAKDTARHAVSDSGYYLRTTDGYLRYLTCTGASEYRLRLLDGGVPVTGAEVVPRFSAGSLALPCIETETGLYCNEQGIPFGYDVTAGGKSFTLAPALSEWTHEGHTFTVTVDLSDPLGIVFDLRAENSRLMDIFAITPVSGKTPARIRSDEFSCYLFASYRDVAEFCVEYETYDSDAVRTTRHVLLDCADLLSSYCDILCNRRDARLSVTLDDWEIV